MPESESVYLRNTIYRYEPFSSLIFIVIKFFDSTSLPHINNMNDAIKLSCHSYFSSIDDYALSELIIAFDF